MFTACDLLEPKDDNHSTFDRVFEDPEFAEGLLIRGYTYIPTNGYDFDETATDDAVTNNKFSSYMRIATGEWSAQYNPQNLWDNANTAIMYINQFLDIVEVVPFKWTDEKLNALYVRRLKGEAYALRGLFKYYLMRNHGGIGTDGALLATPIYNEFLQPGDDFGKPRAAFTEMVNSANSDFAEALKYIPMDYGNLKALEDLPAGFSEITDINDYNTVFGNDTQQRMSGRHATALKARLALLAASPAFNVNGDNTLWETAANITGSLLADIGGVSGLDPKGHIFYQKDQVEEAIITSGDKKDLAEILWRRPVYDSRSLEVNNFPPSLFGDGEINPSQNLVDAFPMANGYPISDGNSGYDPLDPYKNRDPRLKLYIVHNGSEMKGKTIKTGVNAGDDGLDQLQNSTRTGYYLRKLLREDVNADPTSSSSQKHFNTHIRYTELFLNYAEAANEAWGPNAGGPNGFSAKEVIAAIRKRAGIAQPDAYLESIGSKEAMRDLIRNERRLELCFESFRFWDLRRWKSDLTVPAKGVRIVDGAFTYFNVEERKYDNGYMHYGPVPDKEIVKFNLIQNNGWN
jgi:hypothetical protein